MTTSKFSPGQRVRVYEGGRHFDGVVDGIWPDGGIRVKLDISGGTNTYHPKQLRRLKKRIKAVWESEREIEQAFDAGSGRVPIDDAISFQREVLSQFLGKRVRIEITEAKEKK